MIRDRRFRLSLLAILIGAASLAAQQPPDRSHPPQPGPPPALNLPQGAHVKALQAKPIGDLTVEQVLAALPKARALP